MEQNYLLVCEGQTDYFVIDQIAKSLSSTTDKNINIIPLSPQQDATTKEWPQHGWTAIRSWCRLYGNKNEADLAGMDPGLKAAAMRRNWRALLLMKKAHGIILQIDTDIAEHITDLPRFDPTKEHRKNHVHDAVVFWLNDKNYSPSMYLALTTHALEAWILATHPETDPAFSDLPKDFNFEDIEDVEDRLIQLGYKTTKKKGVSRLSKKEKLYKEYALKISENLGMVRSKCQSAEDLCNHLETQP